ncbi:MFS transporter [Schlesneria paludicola]|uniref:MFS transporter n=1 Tax=Schlesneria paludicola TaxID=360056 RepID=UPI000299FC4C|nr:MFS transporter [Schlesneria paludicola]
MSVVDVTRPVAAPAQRLQIFRFDTVPMRAFHLSWLAFFLCFFSWFGLAPLMPVIREELGLTKQQVGWCIIGSVSMTVVFRILVGWLCDRFGPRLTYTWLLVLGAIPVMAVGLATDFATFLIGRILIGAIGASFVVTQYHTSRMFASSCVGTANATAAGWGNLGGGVTQLGMPLLFALITGTGISAAAGWRLCMVCAGVVCAFTGVLYWWLTQDTPEGNFADLRRAGLLPSAGKKSTLMAAARDLRVWALAILYACCFGLELTIDNVAVLYFTDYFQMDMYSAGSIAAGFGMMNLFARALGGLVSDRWAKATGLTGRAQWLLLTILGEGLMLLIFSQTKQIGPAVAMLLLVGLFVKMSNGAVYAIVPFINRPALGSVAGLVGAGGNIGAVAAGFLFQSMIPWPTAFWLLGLVVLSCASFALLTASSAAEVADHLTSPAFPPQNLTIEST